MNRIILSLLLTTAFAAPAIAQNCVNASRCDELGYTKTIADCNGLDTLVCPFDSSKVFCVKAKPIEQIIPCDTGAVLYSDKKCYVNASSERTPIAVVFDGTKRLAVALDEAFLEWGGYQKDIPTLEQCFNWSSNCSPNGKENTNKILTYGKTNNTEYPAAEYCYSYSLDGTKAGDWFLPSFEELKILAAVYDKANEQLLALNKKALVSAGYWSSTEYDSLGAWGLPLKSGTINGYYNKNSKFSVRCTLIF